MLTRSRVLSIVAAIAIALCRFSSVRGQTGDLADAFFDDSQLHEIRIDINLRDWESLKEHFLENTYYPADMRWRDQTVRNLGIRSRGTGSRRPNKPSLRVDFNRYTAGQQFLGLKSFILRNNAQDPTNMRERLSMLFFKRMGLVAQREAHTRLYVRNEYAGLFTIVEAPDRDFLQKNLGENDGHLYKYFFDNAAVLGGAAPFVFDYLGSDPALYVPVPFQAETHEDDPQGEYIARWMQAINDTNAAGWRTRIAEFLDLKKLVRHLAIENFLAEEDGVTGDYGPNNFYVYRFARRNLFTFLPWDKSNTFWAAPSPDYSVFRNITDGPQERRNRLVLRAFQEPDLYALYLDTLLECAASAEEGTPGRGWLETEIEREYDQVRAAALADNFIYTNSEFERGVADLRAFARGRSDAVRHQVADARR